MYELDRTYNLKGFDYDINDIIRFYVRKGFDHTIEEDYHFFYRNKRRIEVTEEDSKMVISLQVTEEEDFIFNAKLFSYEPLHNQIDKYLDLYVDTPMSKIIKNDDRWSDWQEYLIETMPKGNRSTNLRAILIPAGIGLVIALIIIFIQSR